MAEQAQKENRRVKLSKRKPRIVCPICLKIHCRLLEKLTRLKFTAEERLRRLTAFHLSVCKKCKRVSCYAPQQCWRCEAEEPKQKLRHHIFPDWWTTPELTTVMPPAGSSVSRCDAI